MPVTLGLTYKGCLHGGVIDISRQADRCKSNIFVDVLLWVAHYPYVHLILLSYKCWATVMYRVAQKSVQIFHRLMQQHI